jgi:glycolate oxidase iron-sulfur subunit
MSDLRQLTDACVHCGFCLPACPTYQLWGEEMDSPRGRIHLVRQVVDGAPLSPTVAGHLDACLGCLACMPACPSGVRYDKIIDQARVLVEAAPVRGFGDRVRRSAVFALFPYPRRLRLMRGPLRLAHGLRLTGPWLTRRLPATSRALARLAPPVRPRVPLAELIPARPGGRPGPARARVGLLTGCVQSAFFGHVSAATANVLSLEGVEVVVPRGQGCCGALARHTGRSRQAARQARRTVATFTNAGVDAIVTDVAGCGSVMKEYAEVLAGDPTWSARAAELAAKVRDVTQLLVSLGPPVAPRHPLNLTVAYHDACHLSHGQGVRAQPRGLLRSVPGLRVVSPMDADVCCGSAGVYNLLSPEPAAQLGARKATALRATGADVVVAGNPGCLLQIAAAMRADGGRVIPTLHTIEVLDASLRGVSPI